MAFSRFLSQLIKALPQNLLVVSCFALPWVMLTPALLKLGPWPYAQSPFIVLILVSFFLSLGLISYPLIEKKKPLGFNYAFITCFCIVSWSIITSFFSYVPWLSWTGAPQLGLGIIWYIILSIMILGYTLILNSKYFRLFVINICLSALVICCLSFIGDARHGLIPQLKWNPYFINEHIIFIGISLIGFAFSLTDKIHKRILLFLGALIIAASTNRTAFIGVIIGLFLYGMSYYINKKKIFLSNWPRYFFASIIFLIPIGVYFIAHYTLSRFFLLSLHVRYHFWQACIDALLHSPIRLLTGFGWGSYTDTILSSIQDMPIYAIRSDFVYRFPETFLPYQSFPQNWTELGLNINNLLVGNVGFHSHNQFIEALVSSGIIGAFLFSLLLILPVLTCERAKLAPMIFCCSALSITFCGWYETPGTLPYLAIFLASTTTNYPLDKLRISYFFKFIVPCISVILLIFGLSLLYLNICFDKTMEKFSSSNPEKVLSLNVKDYMESSGPGGVYFSIFLRDFVNSVQHRPLTPIDIKVLNDLFYTSQAIKKPSLVMLSSELPLYDFLMNKTQDPRLSGLKGTITHYQWWEKRLDILLKQWYSRVDLMIPYFNWHMQQDRKLLSVKLIENILQKKGKSSTLLNYLKTLEK